MSIIAWDTVLDNETEELLREYYGFTMNLDDAISFMTAADVQRMLDELIEATSIDNDIELRRRAQAAKQRIRIMR